MKYLPFIGALLAATPALAHEGVHVTPHGAEWILVFLGLSVIAFGGAVGLRVRAASAKAREHRK